MIQQGASEGWNIQRNISIQRPRRNQILGFVITIRGRVILDLIASSCMVSQSNISINLIRGDGPPKVSILG